MDYFGTPKENRVWYYDQLSASMSGKVKPGTPGFCAGMVIIWIVLRSQDKDFVVRDDNGENVIDITSEQYKSILKYQYGMEDTPGKKGYQAAFGEARFDVEKAFRVESDNGKYENAQFQDVAFTVASTSTTAKSWFILRLRNAKNAPGHVVAIEVRGAWGEAQTFRLMDPSNGCVEFVGSNTFAQWLVGNFFKGYGGLYTGYLRLHKITPQPAPNNFLGLQTVAKLFSGWIK